MEQCVKKPDNSAHNTVVESVEYIEEEIEESEEEARARGASDSKSNTTAILSTLLAFMVIGGVAGFAYMTRDQKRSMNMMQMQCGRHRVATLHQWVEHGHIQHLVTQTLPLGSTQINMERCMM